MICCSFPSGTPLSWVMDEVIPSSGWHKSKRSVVSRVASNEP